MSITNNSNNKPFSFDTMIRNSYEAEGSNPNKILNNFFFLKFLSLSEVQTAMAAERAISYHLILNENEKARNLLLQLLNCKSENRMVLSIYSIASLKLQMSLPGDPDRTIFESSLNLCKEIFDNFLDGNDFLYTGHYYFMAGWLKGERNESQEAFNLLHRAEEVFRHHQIHYMTASCVSGKLTMMSRINPDRYLEVFNDYYTNLAPYPILQHRMLEDKLRVILNKRAQAEETTSWENQFKAAKSQSDHLVKWIRSTFPNCFQG